MRIKPRNKKEKNEWLYTARGLKVTCVVTTREGRSVKFAEIDELLDEIKDRFGAPPEPVLWLYHLTRIRVLASAYHFSLLKFQNLSLVTEQIIDKKAEQHTFLMPKKFVSPAELESYVTKILNLCKKPD